MWKLSIEDDQGQSTIVQLVRGDYSIGRTEDNTIRLTERNISRHHARLVKQDSTWCFDDLGSYNGCYVNGARVVERQVVTPNDLIQLGDYRLELLADDSEVIGQPHSSQQRLDALAATLSQSAQTDRLIMVVGPTPGREFPLSKIPQKIGRGEECEICVNHSSVSRWHADVNFVGAGRYEIVDHGSSNGIRVNGVELSRGLLDSSDLVELGDIVLKFIPTGQVYRPTPEESRQLAALLGVDVEGPKPTKLERMGLVWKSMSRPTRLGALLLGFVVLVLFTFVVATRNQQTTAVKVTPDVTPSPEQRVLDEATEQLKLGNVEEAHRLLLSIAKSSYLKDEPRFRAIESKWAENLLTRAEQSPSVEARRGMLELVAQTTTVDAATRQRASDLLTKLQDDAVDVAALPSSGGAVAPPSSEPASDDAAATNVGSGNADNKPREGTVTKAASPAMTRTPPTKPATSYPAGGGQQQLKTGASTSSTGQSPAGQKTASSATTNEPNAAELATSGNLDSAKTARDTLKRKVSNGTATEREKRLLRALCRQLADASCSK